MKTYLALVVLVSAHAAPQSPANPCARDLKEESTLAQSCNAYAEFERLNRQLDAAYEKARKLVQHPDNLARAQKTWLQYREDSCFLEQEEYGGLNSVNYLSCRNEMTAKRIAYLKRF